MTDSIKQIDYYYAVIEDKPGKWSWFLPYLRDNSVNMVAFTAFPVGASKSQLDFFPEDPARLLQAAEAAGVTLTGPKKAFLIQGEDTAGALMKYHLQLSEAGVNVHAANGASGGQGRFGYVLWVKPEDYKAAARVLGV